MDDGDSPRDVYGKLRALRAALLREGNRMIKKRSPQPCNLAPRLTADRFQSSRSIFKPIFFPGSGVVQSSQW